MEHKHQFGTWPFADPANTAVYSTSPVMDKQHPILLVAHNSDGDWQLLCGTTNETADGRVVCLGCLFERDPSIGALSDLPLGWLASRASLNSPWLRAPN